MFRRPFPLSRRSWAQGSENKIHSVGDVGTSPHGTTCTPKAVDLEPATCLVHNGSGSHEPSKFWKYRTRLQDTANTSKTRKAPSGMFRWSQNKPSDQAAKQLQYGVCVCVCSCGRACVCSFLLLSLVFSFCVGRQGCRVHT